VSRSDPVRLLLLSGSLGIGGTERYMHQLMQGLSRDRFRIDIALSDPSPTGYPGGVPDDVAVHEIPASIPAGARAVRAIVRRRRIELVHSCAFETSLMALGGTIGTRTRRAVGHHGLHGTYSRRDLRLRLLIDDLAHAIYANSRAATARLPRRHADRTVIIYNGVDPAERSTPL
jgi:hypothetical protein